MIKRVISDFIATELLIIRSYQSVIGSIIPKYIDSESTIKAKPIMEDEARLKGVVIEVVQYFNECLNWTHTTQEGPIL